jgi:hypothetical protein
VGRVVELNSIAFIVEREAAGACVVAAVQRVRLDRTQVSAFRLPSDDSERKAV